MRYYLDTEFDGKFLLSVGIISENGRTFYAVLDRDIVTTDWVTNNVLPILHDVPEGSINHYHKSLRPDKLPEALYDFLLGDEEIHFVTDWPTDVAFIANALITGPGTMIAIPRVAFEVVRVDAYPTIIFGAVQHNAFWDAVALRAKLAENEYLERMEQGTYRDLA